MKINQLSLLPSLQNVSIQEPLFYLPLTRDVRSGFRGPLTRPTWYREATSSRIVALLIVVKIPHAEMDEIKFNQRDSDNKEDKKSPALPKSLRNTFYNFCNRTRRVFNVLQNCHSSAQREICFWILSNQTKFGLKLHFPIDLAKDWVFPNKGYAGPTAPLPPVLIRFLWMMHNAPT